MIYFELHFVLLGLIMSWVFLPLSLEGKKKAFYFPFGSYEHIIPQNDCIVEECKHLVNSLKR